MNENKFPLFLSNKLFSFVSDTNILLPSETKTKTVV